MAIFNEREIRNAQYSHRDTEAKGKRDCREIER
jgi:hypothetical protein